MPAPGGAGPSGAPSSSSSSNSWTSWAVSLPTTQQGRLVITATASAAVTAASIFSYQAAVRTARRRKLARDVDKATHRDREIERKQGLIGSVSADDDAESIDGGTPRYLDHLAHLELPKGGQGAYGRASSPSPLRRQTSKQSVTTIGTPTRFATRAPTYDESLVKEQLARNFAFLGDDAMKKLRNAFVIVVGLGGVGSHTALSLVRSGVGNIRLIDFDQVSLSALNRHAVANLSDVGRPKVVVCQEHFKSISPWVNIQAWVEIFNESEAGRLLSHFHVPGTDRELAPTYVIDCIDNLNTKTGLLAYCHENGIKVFSSMGAGAKCDASRICIGDITWSDEDPLAKNVRRKLRERGIPKIPPKRPGEKPKVKNKVRPSDRANENGNKSSEKAKQNNTAHESAPVTPVKKKAENNNQETEATPRPPPVPMPKPEVPRKSFSKSGNRRSRASSVSSFGSGEGAFFTPEGTPQEEEQDWDSLRDRAQSYEQAISGDPSRSGSLKSPSLPKEAEDKETAVSDEVLEIKDVPPMIRPDFQGRSRSGLDELSPSPVAGSPSPREDPFTIQETPGFAPTGAEDAEQDKKPESGIWKRESVRRQSEGLEETIDPHAAEANTENGQSRAVEGTSSHAPQQANGSQSKKKPARAEPKKVRKAEDANDDPSGPSSWSEDIPQYLIPCVFSTEKPAVDLLPLDEEEFQKDGGVEMLRALEDDNEWRVRVLPVLGPLPAIFGLAIASFVLCDIAGRPGLLDPLQSKVRRKTAERIQKEMEASERMFPPPMSHLNKVANAHWAKGRSVPFSPEDIVYLHQEVFHSRSVVPPFHTTPNAQLLRWDHTLPLSYGNVALFSKEEGKRHIEEVLKKGKSPFEVWGAEAVEMWRKRMEEERWYSRFR